MKKWFVLGGIVSALMLCAGIASAQNNGGGNNGGGNNGGGFRGRGNFDPAQFQQRMMDNVRDRLAFTNDTDWSAVQPLVQKVMDARREVGPGMRMFGGRNRGGNNGDNANNNRRGGMFGSPSPEAEALQNAIDNNAPSSQIKDLLAKYQASQKTKQATLKKAQDNLRQVLSVKQEAEATLLGLLD